MTVIHPLPDLPATVSPDGREIWDWADRFSKAVARRAQINTLNSDISGIGKCCGDCSKWMKSRECPKERNVDGMSRGPSMAVPRCHQFVECWSATRRREELTDKLNALLKDPTP